MWRQRAHHYGNSPQQTQAASIGLPSQKSHVDPSPKSYVSRYSAKPYHFIYGNHNLPSQWLGLNTNCHLAVVTIYPGLPYTVQVYTCYVCVIISGTSFLNKKHSRLNNEFYGLLQTGLFQERDRHERQMRGKFIHGCLQAYCSRLLSILCSVTGHSFNNDLKAQLNNSPLQM